MSNQKKTIVLNIPEELFRSLEVLMIRKQSVKRKRLTMTAYLNGILEKHVRETAQNLKGEQPSQGDTPGEEDLTPEVVKVSAVEPSYFDESYLQQFSQFNLEEICKNAEVSLERFEDRKAVRPSIFIGHFDTIDFWRDTLTKHADRLPDGHPLKLRIEEHLEYLIQIRKLRHSSFKPDSVIV